MTDLVCQCGGWWKPGSVDHGARWGIHVDRDGNPATPLPGCNLPDGSYVTGRSASGNYISPDGSVLD